MKRATDGIINLGNQTLIEVEGFLTENGEVVLSDSDKIGNWKKIKVKFEPEMLRFWISENSNDIEEMCDISIMKN